MELCENPNSHNQQNILIKKDELIRLRLFFVWDNNIIINKLQGSGLSSLFNKKNMVELPGLFTGTNQDDRMKMTKPWQRRTLIIEHDWNWNRQTIKMTMNNWLRFPPKPKEAKLKIVGGDFTWILTTRSWPNHSL